MSRVQKRWISAEVDGHLVAQLEREAEARGISRSEAIRRALRSWTSEAMEEDEERITRQENNHRQVMNRLDYVIGMIREQEQPEARRRSRQDGASRAAPSSRQPGWPDREPEVGPEREGGALAEARKRARRRLG